MKNQILKTILLVIIFNIVLIAFNSNNVNAQSVRIYTIVPPTVKADLAPGAKTEGKMKIINDSNETLTFSVDVRDFIVEDKVGTPKIIPSGELSNKYAASSWVGIIPQTFTVEPQAKYELNYYIQVPPDARPGGHYAAALFTPGVNAQGKGSGTSVTARAGTLFYINVEGSIIESAFAKLQSAFNFQEYGPIKITTEIINQGDLHFSPSGNIVIKDMLGNTVEKQQLSAFNVFPEATRQYENTFGKKFMVGRFQAKLLSSYGKEGNLPLVAQSLYIWVFPWKIAITTILAIIAIVLGIILMKRKKTPPSSISE